MPKAYFIAKLFHIAKQYFTRRKAYFIEKSTSLEVLFSGGEGRIRTTEARCSRFTVCPLWPLGNLPISW